MANPTTRREHAGGANPAVLTTSMSIGDLAFSISTNTGWPTGGVGTFYVVVEPGTFGEEKILCSAQSTSLVTVASGGRGADGTTARTHAIGAVVYPCWTAAESDELNLHAASTTAVHGVAGAVVGTTDTQALTNKTISGASNTLSGIAEASVTNLVTDLAAKQASSTRLAGLVAMSNTIGMVAYTNTDTFVPRSITNGSSKVSVTNGSGSAGAPTIDVVPANFTGIPASGVTNVNGGADLGADVVTLKTRVDRIETITAPIVYTANGTLTSVQAANAKQIRIWGCNGGGGSGGCATTGAAQSAHSGPGAGGATAFRTITTVGLTYPLQVNVAAAGTAGGAGNTNGGVGGQSSVIDNNGAGSTLWTPGVQGANQKGLGGAAAATVGDAGTPGFDGSTTSSVADLVVPGQGANVPTRVAAAVITRQWGGNSVLGAGGLPGNTAGPGGVGTGFGAGGGGSYLTASLTQIAGAAGAPGVVVIELIY